MFGEGLKIAVDKLVLLEILKTNREKHEKNYSKAKEGFKILLEKELKGKLDALRAGKKVRLTFKNQKPVSYLGQYDEVIGMLELATDKELVISTEQYKQYVKDDWSWKQQWSVSNMDYLSAAASK